jgi:translocation and assembly module TamB
MTRRTRRFIVGIAIVPVLIGLVLAGFLFYLETNHAQSLIQAKVNETIPGAISWGRFRFSLLKGELELRDVVLKDPTKDLLAGFDRLFLDISWTPLLRGELTVSELILEKPWIALQMDRQGKLNLASAFPAIKPKQAKEKEKFKKKQAWPIHFTLKSAKLSKISISYETRDVDYLAEIKHLDFAADVHLSEKSGNFALEIAGGCLNGPKVRAELDQFKIAAALRENKINLQVFKAATPVSELQLSGYIYHVFTHPMLDLEINSNVSLPEVQKILCLKPQANGRITARLNVNGDLNNPAAILCLDYEGGKILKKPIDNIHLDLQLKDRFVNINDLHITAASGNLKLRGSVNLQKAFTAGLISAQKDLEAISYELNLVQEGMRLEQLIPEAGDLKGILYSDAYFCGEGISPQKFSAKIALKFFIKQMTAGPAAGPVDFNLNAGASLDKGMLSVEHFVAVADGFKLQTCGHLNFPSKKFHAKVLLDAPRLEQTLSLIGIKNVKGNLKLKSDASGCLKRPVFDFSFQGNDLCFQGISIGSVQANANLNQSGILKVTQLSLNNQGSSLEGGGTIQLFKDSFEFGSVFPVNFFADIRDIELKDFLNQSIASGKIDGRLTFSGNLKALQAKCHLRGKNLGAENIRIGDVAMNARFSEGNLYVDRMEVSNGKSGLRLSGTSNLLNPKTMKPLEDPLFKFKLEGDTVFIEDFTDKIRGKLSLFAHIEGSIAQPRGTFRLNGTDVDFGIQKIERVELFSELDEKGIWIDPIRITVARDELIEGRGWFSPEKMYQITLASKGISLSNINKIRDRKIASGKIIFNISGNGTFDDPRMNGKIILNNFSVQGKPVDDMNLYLNVREQLVKVSGNSNFNFDASFHLKKKEFWASILFNETDLAPYFKIAGRNDVSGTITGTMEARGNTELIDRMEALADFSKLDLFIAQKRLIRSRNFKIFFKNEEIFIPGIQLDLLTEGNIDISGRGELFGPLCFKLNGKLPLRGVGLFVEDLDDLAGDISFSAQMDGALPHPDIRADVVFEKMGLTVPALSQKFHDVCGRVRITPKTLMIDQINGQLDTGRFDLSGRVDLEGFQPVRMFLSANADALPLKVPDTMDMCLNARLTLEGTPQESTVRGETVIIEGTYYKDVNLSLLQAVGQKKRESVSSPPDISLPFLKNMNLDISINRKNPFIIDNNLAQMEIAPDLRVKGTLNRPIISGRASIESGTIEYQKKTFLVKKGIIDFINPYKIEPVLDIKSEVKVRQWIILLEITGTMDRLGFKLSSEPPETDGDILSLLALGKTSREMIEGEGGNFRSAEQMLAEMIASAFEKDIKKVTGIDTLEVENGGDGDEQDRIKVTVGKELSKRMTVKYTTASEDGERNQRATAEYKFLENVLLSGFQNSNGTFGGALQYRLEFR